MIAARLPREIRRTMNQENAERCGYEHTAGSAHREETQMEMEKNQTYTGTIGMNEEPVEFSIEGRSFDEALDKFLGVREKMTLKEAIDRKLIPRQTTNVEAAKETLEQMKRRILIAIAKFGGKVMFAALKFDGIKEIAVTDPTTTELLMEFPWPRPR
jgi:hypothetical protein